MKKVITLVLGVMFSLFAVFSFGQMKSPASGMVLLLQKLNQAGYQRIHEIEYNRGVYEVEAYDMQCHKKSFRVNSQNMMIPPLNKAKRLTMLQAAQRVQAAGYHNVYEIEFDNGRYEVKVYDEREGKIRLRVDPVTGKISKNWF